jgi:SEC-C motif-containing protein
VAPTAEALMRSRYSAYVLHLEDYLLESWHSSTRPVSLDLENASGTKWLGLKVLRAETGGDRAVVEFVARYKIGGGSAVRLHETSRFLHEDGRWFYLDGDLDPV